MAFFDLYNQFLNLFPMQLHGLISVIVAVLFVVAIVKVLQRDFIFLILLVVLLPASLPVLKNIANVLVSVITFLIGKGK